MSEADAQKIIVGTIVVVGATVAWHGVKTSGKASPNLRTFTALFTLAAVMLIAATVAPDLAAGFAVLIGLGVVVSRISK